MITIGKDKGRTGKVVRALPRLGKVVVEGLNLKKKHQRPRREREKGQIIQIASPVHVSNVMLIDPKTKKPTRVRYGVIKGKKVRIAKRSGSEL